MTDITPVQKITFSEFVTVVAQGADVLRPHVTRRTGIVGRTLEVPRLTRGMARIHVPSSPRIPINAAYEKTVIQLNPWSAAMFVDDLNATTLAFDERPYWVQVLAYAIARRNTQAGLDTLIGGLPTATIPDGGTGMTDAKLRQVARIMDARAVPYGQRKLVVSASVYDQIRGLPIAQNKDFGDTAAGRTGKVPMVYGLDVIMVDDARDEGGLPIAGGVRRCYAFDQSALVMAYGKEETLDINWVPERRSWLVERVFTVGAGIVDPNCVLRVDCVES
jgi:hypothetical protein